MILRNKVFLLVVIFVITACGGGGTTTSSSGTSTSTPSSEPSISNKSLTVSNGEVLASQSFLNAGGEISSCTVSPALPSGLNLGSDCSISGTPTENQSAVTYTVTATNSLGSDTASMTIEVITSVTRTVTLLGTVTYDSVPFQSSSSAKLDYNNISQKIVRGALVEVLNSAGTVIGTTSTDASGAYSLSVTGTTVKVRISAKLYKAVSSGQSSWDFQVQDNTNSNALYVMEGSLASLGSNSTQTRTLNAPSGWDGSSYSSTRVAGPFAILDVVYQAIQLVTSAQSDAVFAPLNIFWSKDNISSTSKVPSLGQILTSHFDGTSLYILGKENSDTDEYDKAIVAHEWGHYYEANFSRADNIGGGHGNGDMLDIRVAFGEGFGTAMGCIIIGSPLYQDSAGSQQGTTGVFANLENGGSRTHAGWYSEQSIYDILYDIYDSNDDTGDTLSLGFTPIHNLLIGTEKNTGAFTSIFSFIAGLKAENPTESSKIDTIVANENIATITDIYGTGRTNRNVNANPLYTALSVGSTVTISPDYSATSTSLSNRLGTYNFINFTIPSDGTYTITASSGTSTNLKFNVYKAGSKTTSLTSSSIGSNISGQTSLSAGTYRMELIDYSFLSGQTFTITLN